MTSVPEFPENFQAAQLDEARKKLWRQQGDAVLTSEAAREWIDSMGLVLFAPRPQQLAVPSPSLMEATLGAKNDAPTAAEAETAKTLVANLAREGAVIPLNLTGVPSELPDFVVSAQMFAYVFTLRGDKAWKVPPSITGAVKVTQLGLNIYTLLTERGEAMSAAELASELGREVTETAILRALTDLWGQMRVLPVLQTDGGPTLWELATRRFQKAIKSGANAGQPTAVSALVSVYLTQAVAATEEQVSAFLSPLTARSKVREVLHGLTIARQLETGNLGVDKLLYVPGTLPEFAPVVVPTVEGEAGDAEAVAPTAKPERIASFKPRKSFEERRPRERKEFGEGADAGERKPYGERKTFARREDGERKPFRPREARPFDAKRPWSEDRKPRAPRKGGWKPRTFAASAEGEAGSERRSFTPRPERGGDRKPFAGKKSFGDRKPFAAKRAFDGDKPRGERKPWAPREGGEGATERKPYDRARKPFGAKPAFGMKKPWTPREDGATSGERPARKPYGEKKSFGGKKPFGAKPAFGAKKAWTPREDGAPSGDRPARKPFGEKKSFGGKKSFGAKPAFGAKRSFDGPKPAGKFGGKPGGKFGGKTGGKPFQKRAGGSRPPRRESGERA